MSQILAFAPYASEGIIITIEADIRRGIPGIDMSGLAEGAVRESRERVRAAFRNSGIDFPQDRLLINLAPAGVRKDGAALDLPIALAVYAASRERPFSASLMVLGELELSGKIRPVRGCLAAVAAGIEAGVKHFIVPKENIGEAAVLCKKQGLSCRGPETLSDAVDCFLSFAEKGLFANEAVSCTLPPAESTALYPEGDFSEVQGQALYKRAMEIAAAGGHNTLVFGPPGGGKTMLARRTPGIMAALTEGEAVEATRLHSLAGCLGHAALIDRPPFRSPHHSASAEGLLGGGRMVRPGEVSLAHLGLLFLDEAPEFRVNVLQALREPLEEGSVTIVRAEGPLHLPADFQLILAANPCPCGRLGQKRRGEKGSANNFGAGCFCAPDEIYRYWKKFSGALLDRVELRVPVTQPDMTSNNTQKGERSALIAGRVEKAVSIQRERYKKSSIRRNVRMQSAHIEAFCRLSPSAESLLVKAVEKLNLSGRAFHGTLRVARTIADLQTEDTIKEAHIEEAIEFRRWGEDPYDILSFDRFS